MRRSYRGGFNSRRRYARGNYSGRRWGSSSRRARGNMRAANQQNDISNVTINMMKKIKTGVTSMVVDEKELEIGTCALNIFELLKKSDFYNSYSNMYDQFRINRIQVKVTPITWQTYNQFNLPNKFNIESAASNEDAMTTGESTGNPVYPGEEVMGTFNDHYQAPVTNNEVVEKRYIVPQALTIVTAWDRTGLDSTQIKKVGDLYYTTIGDAISTYSSAKTTQLVAGANFNCVRYLYPSSQQEKSLYFSTTDLVDQIAAPNVADKWYQIRPVADPNYQTSKITNLQTDPNCPFKPTFLIGVLKVDSLRHPDGQGNNPEVTMGQIYPVTFNLEFDIGVTFRGLRKTQIV